MKSYLIAFLSLLPVMGSASQNIEDARKHIDRYIEETRDKECWGPGSIGNITSSEIEGEKYFFAVYGYQIGPCRDRNHWTYLGVFKENDGKLFFVTKALVGGKRKLLIESIRSEGRNIYLSGKTWKKEDGMCCPSTKETVSYSLIDSQLKKISPNNKMQQTPSATAD